MIILLATIIVLLLLFVIGLIVILQKLWGLYYIQGEQLDSERNFFLYWIEKLNHKRDLAFKLRKAGICSLAICCYNEIAVNIYESLRDDIKIQYLIADDLDYIWDEIDGVEYVGFDDIETYRTQDAIVICSLIKDMKYIERLEEKGYQGKVFFLDDIF